MIIASPSSLNPRLTQKYRDNAEEYRQARLRGKNWDVAERYEIAQDDTVKFRQQVNRHKTFPHMRPWLGFLNTGEDSRYLRGIAGEDTLILAPRESAKSTVLGQWTAQQIGRHTAPWNKIALKVLCVSYDLTTAAQRSRQIMAIIESKPYQKIFPWVRPSKKKWGEREWAIDFDWAGLPTTEEQYTFVCSGLTGAINSRRCLVGETLVTTELCDIPIAQLGSHIGVRVRTYNLETKRLEWGRLKAITSRQASDLYEIRALDKSIICTSDHPIYTVERGYQLARDLTVFNTLATFRDGNQWKNTVSVISKLDKTETVYDIEVEGNHNFFANGILVKNCHIVLIDDLIKSPEAIRSDSVRAAMVSNWENVVQYVRFDGSRAVGLGTRMAPNDIYTTTFIKEKGWNVFEQSALLTNDRGEEYSYWEPESDRSPGTPLVRLQWERENAPVSFTFQRQNKIIRVSAQSIEPDLIIRGILPNRFEKLVLGADLSAGKRESNDYTALVLGGVHDAGDRFEYWIIDAWEDRIMGNVEKLDAMIEMWDMWRHLLPQTQLFSQESGEWENAPLTGLETWFDSSAYGLSLQGDYESHIIGTKKINNWVVRPVPASGRGDKLTRLRRHTGLFHNKLIKFNMYGRSMPDGRRPLGRLIQQITEFGAVDHDDLADGFELCVSGMRSHLPLSKGNY